MIDRPALEWSWLGGKALDPAVAGEPRLATVSSVSASVDHEDKLYVVVTGRMLKRDGGAGPRRGCVVDLAAEQPAWLVELIVAARQHLAVHVEEGWWHPNVKDGRVHDHKPNQPATMHRLCEPVYTRRREP